MSSENPCATLWYENLIQDLAAAIQSLGAAQVLDDLKFLDLTGYEELVKIVMKADVIKKQTAVLLKDPYFQHANQD